MEIINGLSCIGSENIIRTISFVAGMALGITKLEDQYDSHKKIFSLYVSPLTTLIGSAVCGAVTMLGTHVIVGGLPTRIAPIVPLSLSALVIYVGTKKYHVLNNQR